MTARRRFGSVRKLPSNRYQARYLDGNGERITAPDTFETKGDAQRWLAAVETDMARGDWHDPRLGEQTLSVWAQQWLATKRPSLAAATASLYEYLWRIHVEPHFGEWPIGRIRPSDVQAWLATLHGTDLSPNTVAKAYRLLKGMTDGAVHAGLIPKSPCTLKGASTERSPEMKVATPEQVAALAAAVGPRWEALVFMAAYSGLRWDELAGLRRCDIDVETNAIRVRRKLGEVDGNLSFSAPKSSAGVRTLGIPEFVARSLAVHIDLYALPGDEGLIFTSIEGTPLRRANFRQRIWEPATEKVGVSGLRFHDLRHTASTLAAASGASLRALMTRMGHASPRAALRYQHVVDGQDADIVKYLERFDQVAPSASAVDRDAPQAMGTRRARTRKPQPLQAEQIALDLGQQSGGDRTRTDDFLLAKQVL